MARLALHTPPAVGFEAPFEMLAACHERVHRMLGLLQRLGVHLMRQGIDAQAASAARDVMRYFDTAGPAHHEDEERHVLPRLVACGQQALAEHLHADHLRMTDEWAAVRETLDGVTQGEWPRGAKGEAIVARWLAFSQLYDDHIALEESRAFPAARQQCSAPDLDHMGREMAQRRGAPLPEPPSRPA